MATRVAHLCPDCMGPLAIGADGSARCTLHGGVYRVLFQRVPVASAAPSSGAAPTAASPAGSVLPGLFCPQHPDVPATQQCHYCFASMCDTCDFTLPDDVHICPKCATDSRPKLGPRRAKSLRWSMGLALSGTLAWTMSFVGGALGWLKKGGGDSEVFFAIAGIAITLGPIIGLALGVGAMDRRLGNPPSIRAAVIWNGILVGAFLLTTLAK